MVVDDDRYVCDLLDSVLSEAGYRARCVSDGEAAWAAVQEDQPDLIVSDIKMPRLDGIELARRLHEAEYGIPIILMSAGFEDRDGVARAFLRKPFDVGELLDLIAVVMRERENGHVVGPLADALVMASTEFEAVSETFHAVHTTGPSDRFLATIVESSDDAIISKTLEGIITSWNQAAEDLYGYCASEAIGKSISLIIPPERPNELPTIMDQLRRGERIEHFETERVHKRGNRCEVSVSIFPICDEDGQIAGAASIARDITVQKRIEREQQTTLEMINRVGRLLTAELDLETLVQALTDAATTLTEAQFGAFFYNALDERGEFYTLYTIAGVPREAFATFPMPRNTALFGPTFRGEGTIRIADVRRDSRFGHNPP